MIATRTYTRFLHIHVNLLQLDTNTAHLKPLQTMSKRRRAGPRQEHNATSTEGVLYTVLRHVCMLYSPTCYTNCIARHANHLLAQIFGRSANTGRTNRSSTDEKDKEGDDERNRPGHRVPACFVPGDEVDLRVKWQEKVFGPREIITMAGTFRRKKSIKQRAEVAVNRHTSKLEVMHGNRFVLFTV